MEKYRITKKQRDILKSLEDFKYNPSNYSIIEENSSVYIMTEDIEDLIDAIEDYIVFKCLDDKYNCNEEGKALYVIHDELVNSEPEE